MVGFIVSLLFFYFFFISFLKEERNVSKGNATQYITVYNEWTRNMDRSHREHNKISIFIIYSYIEQESMVLPTSY